MKFGALGQPHLAAWIMASRDAKARRQGAMIAIAWGLMVYAGMALLGLSAHALLPSDVAAEAIFFEAASAVLPAALAGVVAAATLSAIMSTVDSQLLVAGGAVSHDLGLERRFPGQGVLISRLAILLVCGLAVVLTFSLPSSIFERTLFAWTTLGASFGPVVVARALGRAPGGSAVLSSILLGFSIALAFEFLLPIGPGGLWPRTVPWLAAALPLLGSAKSGSAL
ncbi:MAG: hypothetical protein AAF737_05700 [Pseudomonadota bacterium]